MVKTPPKPSPERHWGCLSSPSVHLPVGWSTIDGKAIAPSSWVTPWELMQSDKGDLDVAMSHHPNGDHCWGVWSVFPFTKPIFFGYPVFFTYTHVDPVTLYSRLLLYVTSCYIRYMECKEEIMRLKAKSELPSGDENNHPIDYFKRLNLGLHKSTTVLTHSKMAGYLAIQ